MKVSDIIKVIESYAPTALQESYDNCGLQTGNPSNECTGVLVCVDVTPSIVDEAKKNGLNLIVSHHPLIFKGIKSLTGKTAVENSLISAIKDDIAIYAAHTSIDSAFGGISYEMAKLLDLKDVTTLCPRTDLKLKLTVWIPKSHLETVREALFDVGCGRTIYYDKCSYSSDGEGTFRPLEGSNPFVGKRKELHKEPETKLELLVDTWMKSKAEKAILASHPYEEPAYEFTEVSCGSSYFGLGAIGNLSKPTGVSEFIEKVKATFNSPITRCSKYSGENQIVRVGLCGGSGSSFIPAAISQGAQAFITSDTKYHDFVDYANKILIVDIGHYESESCSKAIFERIITEKFPNFAVRYSQSESNPIIYM